MEIYSRKKKIIIIRVVVGKIKAATATLTPVILLCLIIAPTAISLVGQVVGSNSKEPLCGFPGPDKSGYIEITDYVIYGPKNPGVGDFVVVFFTLKYIGESGHAVIDRIYVKAILPDGSIKEYEDRSLSGRVLGPGDTVRFHREITLTMEGEWRFWPAFEYRVGGNTYRSPDNWHVCTIPVSVKETATTTTTTRPLPDLAFNPQYTQPIGYNRCKGFYAHIKNTGRTGISQNSTVLFRIRYGNVIVEDRRVSIPPLGVGEEFVAYSGPFIGVPDDEYRVTVILDPDNQLVELSESNTRSMTMRYHSYDLPTIDLEVGNLEYTGTSITFTVKNTGCMESPQTHAYLGVKYPPTGEIIELDSLAVPSLSGQGEAELSFNDPSYYIASNPELSGLGVMEIHVWVDPVNVTYNVVGWDVVIRESNTANNEEILRITTALIIEGPDKYFIERETGYTSYIIPDPRELWRAVGGVPGQNITYSYEIEGCNAQLTDDPLGLIVTVPGQCSEHSLTLRITASSGGVVAEKRVSLIFYSIAEPRSRRYYLYSTCINKDDLGADKGFVFAGDEVEIWFHPNDLLLPVTHTHASGQRATYEEAGLEIVVKWQVNGFNETYVVPSDDISVDWGNHRILFTIPNDAVFDDLNVKAIPISIELAIRPGSGQEIEREYHDYWLHEEPVLQVHLRSYNFPNSECPGVSWDMWEKFWGKTAVNDCITEDFCPWKDPGSWFIYNYVFKQMCRYGRCFSFALTGQKFYERDVYGCGACSDSSPKPFAISTAEQVCTDDICESAGESGCPTRMYLNTYITYEYMWSLDERNVRRGLDKFERYLMGEDIVLETLNELRAWESLPDDSKWSNPYVIMMMPPSLDEVTNAHAVLAYRVEEINQSFVRVWVIDSNRPFQPNNSSNQDRSYIDFYCCGPDGRWNFEFKFDDGETLSDFLFASPTDMFEGESAAITTADVVGELFKILRLLRRLGSTDGFGEDTDYSPSLYMVFSEKGLNKLQVEDSEGGRIFDPSMKKYETDPNKISIKIAPLPIPAPAFLFIGDGREPVKIMLQPSESGEVIVVSEDEDRSIEVRYEGGVDQLNMFRINPQAIAVSGTSLRGFMVTGRSVSRELAYEAIVSTRPGSGDFEILFNDNGSLEITNLGGRELVFDLRFNKYSFEDRRIVGETYDGLTVEPKAKLAIAPETWDNIVGGRITVRVDRDSDGRVDEELSLEPRSIRPVAEASDIYVYANETGYARIMLDGSASYSPRNKPLTWTWRGDFLEGDVVRGEKVTVTMATGTWIVELTVSDGELESIPKEITVHVLPPGATNTTIPSTTTTTPATQTTSTYTITSTSAEEERTQPTTTTSTPETLENLLKILRERTELVAIALLVLIIIVLAAYALHRR